MINKYFTSSESLFMFETWLYFLNTEGRERNQEPELVDTLLI